MKLVLCCASHKYMAVAFDTDVFALYLSWVIVNGLTFMALSFDKSPK